MAGTEYPILRGTYSGGDFPIYVTEGLTTYDKDDDGSLFLAFVGNDVLNDNMQIISVDKELK